MRPDTCASFRIEALPEIVSAIGGRLEIYLDSGVRSGADVVKALSLGARAVFVGRPAIWGLTYNVTLDASVISTLFGLLTNTFTVVAAVLKQHGELSLNRLTMKL
ncbi:hypothetical protein HPB49_006635 [Dermacentor silvarum]|uniref:Uncharacterized protein n=1 Tax=Dermacentor silvarum TaxID=543639 RepID=A0ACB8CQG3_DERSI|nr:hypothetical protein HPB49_006635 [Dermacentor silvarum]